MKVLFVASEAVPFSKTGGLGDVIGSLPKELVHLGIDARVVLPKHMITKTKFQSQLKSVCHFDVTLHEKVEYAGIETLTLDSVIYYFIDNDYYFGNRETLYGHYDDGERYGFFDLAIVQMMKEMNYYPDILHCNDWQSGLLPYLLKLESDSKFRNIKTMLTIHNIAYQGIFGKDLTDYLNIPYSPDLEFDDMVNYLKTGIQTAHYVTTVSKTYANEILHDYFAYGMNQILKTRTATLFGIINGIDYEDFSPQTDKTIAKQYSLYNYLSGKQANKENLRNYYHLEQNNKPIIGIVSRLTEAKGFDLIKLIIEDLIKSNQIQLVLLGSGDPEIENYYRYLREEYPKNVGVYIGYNDQMARKIYAGSDLFLMPSRFEPCGLSQLISLKYGTLPIVRKTGGLRDTIIPYDKFTKTGNGFGFEQFDSSDLLHAIEEAIAAYKDKPSWKMLVKRAMQEDFSWEQSAKQYIELYQKLQGGK